GIRRDPDSFAKVQIRRHFQEVWLRLEGYFGNVLNLGSGVDLGRRESLGEMGPGKRQNRDDATETWTSPHCCLLARSRTATDGRSERSRRNLRFGVQVDTSIPQSGLLGACRAGGSGGCLPTASAERIGSAWPSCSRNGTRRAARGPVSL